MAAPGGEENELWEGMQLRERREAAHRAGMRLSDWEAAQELKRAILESKADETGTERGQPLLQQPLRVPEIATNPEQKGPYLDDDDGSASYSGGAGFYEDGSDGGGGSGGGGGGSKKQPLSQNTARRSGGGRSQAHTEHVNKSGVAHSGGEVAGGSSSSVADEKEEAQQVVATDALTQLGGDVLRRIVLFLDPDSIVHCALVSPRWKFASDEAVYYELCRRTYLAQSRKQHLDVVRWKSWRTMFVYRPRLRTNGVYWLKSSYIKTPVRDMFSSYVPGSILEVTTYRYFRFFPDGRVAYALLHEPPKEAIKLFKTCQPRGRYEIRRREVTVEIPEPHARIRFCLSLENGERGHWTQLTLLEHTWVAVRDAQGTRCSTKVSSEDAFKYRRVWAIS